MNKLGKDCMPCTVKRSMAIILTLMMIISSLLSSGNLIYAYGDGELVLKSASHPEAVREAVIDGNKVTFTLPSGFASETLDLKDIICELKTEFNQEKIIFPSGSDAEIDGPTVEMEVKYTYIGNCKMIL